MSGINRVSTLSQQTQNLLNLLRNEQSLNDVLLQQSTGNKAPTYAGVATQAGQLLNVDSLQNQAQGFLDNINSATTRLNLTDTALQGIGNLASNFQQELQQLQSSPTPPNISDLARTTLEQLGSLLNSSDGTQFLFSGSQQSAAPVASVNTTRIPTKTLSLAGNLDTQGLAPVNGNVAPPQAGSFVDVSLAGQEAIYDSNGIQYDTTLRFVHQSAGPPDQWQAYIIGLTRSDDNSKSATSNGQPITELNPVKLGNAFDPGAATPPPVFGPTAVPANPLVFDNLGTAGVPQIGLPAGGGTINVQLTPDVFTGTAAPTAFTQADNATASTRLVLNQLNLNPNSAVGDTTSITLSGANALFATGATPGSDKFNATLTLSKMQNASVSGGLTDPAGTVLPLTTQGAGYNPATTIVTFPPPPNGGTTATAIANVNGAGQVTSITITNPGSGYFDPPPPVATITDTGAVPGTGAVAPSVMVQYERWQASLTSLTDASTGAAITVPAVSAATPYVLGTFIPNQASPVLGDITINANPVPSVDNAGNTFTAVAGPPNVGSLGVTVRSGTLTRDPSFGSQIQQFSVNPLAPPGTPQTIELSANLSSNQPVNISVSQATAGSFADISFQNAQAVVDSKGEAHNLTIRIVKTATGPDLYQAYAIGLTDVETGKDSTTPPISPTNPVALGPAFDPTAAGGTTLTFSPTLANSASMSLSIPITTSTFDTQGGNIVLTAPENSSTAASTTPHGQLNMVGNLSSAAVANAAPTGLGSLSITAGGAGFNVGDVITFNAQGGGTAAVAKVTSVNAGAITGIQITNPGSGYTVAPTINTVVPVGGAGATFTANFGPSLTDITGAIGGISSLAVATAGTGYAPGDIVTFAAPPGGTAATATVATVGAGGAITGFTMIDSGSGYSSTSNLTITATTGAGTGGIATPTLSQVNANNAFDLNFFGNQALRDSTGRAYDATVRVLYGSIGGGSAGWRAYVTNLTDPATGASMLPAASLPTLIGTPPFDAFHPQDAGLGPITIPANGPQNISIPGAGTLSLTIPFNTENFTSNAGATALTVGGEATTSLSANIADTSYFQPGGTVFDTSQSQLQLRTAPDSVVKFGVRADNPAFEQLFRVLNFFKDQSVPANPGEVDNASRLINTAIAGINALRANVANTQAVLKNEQNFHQTTLSLAKDTHASILTVDSATTAMNLNALSNLLQESFATLGTIKSLSLVNFLK